MKKIVCLILTLTFVLSAFAFAGCGKKTAGGGEKKETNIARTDIKIVDDGETDYSVVIPLKASAHITPPRRNSSTS